MRILIIFTALTLSLQQLTALTPSQRYFDQHPLSEIESYFTHSTDLEEEDLIINQKIKNNFPFFLEVIGKENEHFFAYHAAPQAYGLFQDIIRAVYEEILQINIPLDFHFLRAPLNPSGQHDDELTSPKATVFQNSNMLDTDLRNCMIDFFLLKPLNTRFNKRVSHLDLNEDQINSIIPLFYYFRENSRNSLIEIESPSQEEAITHLISQQLAPLYQAEVSHLFSFLKSQLSYEESVDTFLNENDSSALMAHKFCSFMYSFYDSTPDNQQLYLSCNLSLFGNYTDHDDSSLYYFSSGQCAEGGVKHIEYSLDHFFSEVGLPSGAAEKILTETQKIIREAHIESGILLQFFDTSDERFALADRMSYLSYKCGHPIQNAQNISTSLVLKKDLSLSLSTGRDVQLRLIMDDKIISSFDGTLRTLRYDHYPEEIKEKIDRTIRMRIRQLAVDQNKKKAYLSKIRHLILHKCYS